MTNKIGWFLATFFGCLVGLAISLGSITDKEKDQVVLPPNPIIRPPEPLPNIPAPKPQIDPEFINVQVPIPKDCRVFNKSGSQCVWCSIECLGRYHKVKDLYEGDMRITKYHTWATWSGEVYHVMKTKYPNVKWAQISNISELKSFLRKYVAEKKIGVGFTIPGHMLNMVNYDEENKTVKVIDNIGPKALEIQEWSMAKFDSLAGGWVLTVFPPDYQQTTEDNDNLITNCTKELYGNIRPWFLDFEEYSRRISVR